MIRLASLFIPVLLLLTFGLAPAHPARAQFEGSVPTEEIEPEFAVDWMNLLYDRIMAEGTNPPAAARIYGYAGVTLYEAVVWGMPNNRSLSGQLNEMPAMPYPEVEGEYDWASVGNAALATVLNGLFVQGTDETRDAFATLRDEQMAARLEVFDADVVERSLEYGDNIGKAILGWAEDDGYLQTRGREYTLPEGSPELWVATNPDLSPVEPYWGEVRPFVLAFTDECAVQLNMPFDTDPDSTFYRQAQEVMDVGDDLTPEERATAEFWLDNLRTTGTPAGHWVLIENQLVDQLDLTLDRAAEMYGMVGIVLADSFTSCWSLKYQVLLLRPETYINEYISRRWRPYITTPMFPEYPSGHSTASGAAAEMLTFLFGTVAFTDESKVRFDMEPRSYTSFEQAAQEAAISRLYGGIHYRAAIENGLDMGRCVAQRALDNIVMNQITQGE